MSSDGLKEIIDLGNDLTVSRYYGIAATTVFFYDYFLTLADEIKYAWHGRKSWVFAIFLANRYLPVAYQIWFLYTSYNTTFHQQLCEKTAFYEVLVAVGATLIAQIVLTLRIYAVTRKNRIIASCFSLLTISQFVLGLYLSSYAATKGAVQFPQIPLPVYMLCNFITPLFSDIAFPTISLVYDLLAFSIIVYLVVRSNVNKVPIPSLLKTIAQDATYYFLIIFTSHFVLVMFMAFTNPTVKHLPALGNIVYLPLMISRLMLSLKKAGTSQEHGWSLVVPTTHTTLRFVERRGGVVTRDEIPLDTFTSMWHEGAQSQA